VKSAGGRFWSVLIGKGADVQLHLRRIRQADLPALLAWIRTEEELVQWSGPWNFEFPLDERQLTKFFLTETLDDRIRRIQYVAVDEGSGAPVGQIGFSRIWLRTAAAHVGPVIVAPGRRGRGIGLSMVREILRIGFDELCLHRIELVVFDFNKPAIACYEKAGFRTEGVLRDIVRMGDTYWHWQAMSILATEYR
jgi:RimJ/RimL family protein N-acetyltransferase